MKHVILCVPKHFLSKKLMWSLVLDICLFLFIKVDSLCVIVDSSSLLFLFYPPRFRFIHSTSHSSQNLFPFQIREVRDFAGQEIEVRKLVDADSKEATEKAKAPASSAVDAVLEQIKKKPKLSVLDKTKKDWGEFKEENKGLEDELDAYKKSSNQYLERVSFLERTDYREFERERDARLALQARRRTDMREDL